MVLFILAVVWAVYLASWLRSRTENRSVNSISSFSKHLSTLERTSPAGHLPHLPGRHRSQRRDAPTGIVPLYASRKPGAVMSLGAARRRRRDVLFGLGGAVMVTLLLAVVGGGLFMVLFVLALLALGAYVGLLVRAQQLATERRAKVRYLAPSAPEADNALRLPRSASAH